MTIGRIGFGLTLLLALAGTLGFIATQSFLVALLLLAAPLPAFIGLLTGGGDRTLTEASMRWRGDDAVEQRLDESLRLSPHARTLTPVGDDETGYVLPGVPALACRSEPDCH
jgi:hypothetical protein